MRQELIDEFRRAVRERDAAREKRAKLAAKLADLKTEIRVAGVDVAKCEKTVDAVQHEILTGESGFDLLDVARRNANVVDDERPGQRAPTDFFGKRQRGTSHN